MNKNGLIEAVAAKANVSKAAAANIIDAALEVVVETVKNGENVQLVGYANIAVVEKAAGKARNPQTGAIVEVPARKVVKIKAGKKFAL